MRAILILLLAVGCMKKNPPPSFICASLPDILEGSAETYEEDMDALNAAARKCREEESCLISIRRIHKWKYAVHCSKSAVIR